eukprot:4414869-Pyramimonas_sp.AAC.1
MRALLHDEMLEVICRHPRRSSLSTTDVPRACIDLLFPASQTELYIVMQMRYLRRTSLPADSFYGMRSMFVAKDAMILEVASPMCLHHYWKVCSQLVAVKRGQVLAWSDAAAD